MDVSEENAEIIFNQITDSINQACEARDWFITSRMALRLGFIQSDVSTAFAYSQRFDFVMEPNIYICLTYKSLDPSGPFLPLPDVSKFEVALLVDEKIIKTYQKVFIEMNEPSSLNKIPPFTYRIDEVPATPKHDGVPIL